MSRDLRKYVRDTNVRLMVGAFLILLLIGVGAIWLIYGGGAASLGFFCIMAGLSPVVLILIVFFFIDWILKHAGRK